MTILNTYTELFDTGATTWGFSEVGLYLFCIGIFSLSIGIYLLRIGIKEYKNKEFGSLAIICCLCIIIILSSFLMVYSWNLKEVRVEKTVYEVTVDDTVSFNDFYNKYEILEQQGEVYVITEKEP